MQIVIDIPEEVKHKVYAYGLSLCPSDKEQLINAIKNGTPHPKTGHWIRHTDASGNSWHACPACGHITYTLSHYCPDCGMRLEAPS